MYRQRLQRRLEKGDQVLLLRGSASFGLGTIEWIGMMNKIYKFTDGNATDAECDFKERVVVAKVRFGENVVPIILSQLINASQAQGYDALEQGDLVVFGKRSVKRGVVITVSPRKRIKNGITAVTHSIVVLADGIKKRLHPCQDIIMIQRARDYLHFD